MQEITTCLLFWGKEIPIKFVFSKNNGETIDTQEQNVYEEFIRDRDHYSEMSLAELKSYIHANEREILAYTSFPAIPRDVFKIVSIEAIRIYHNRALAIFCDTSWDSHGLALYHENGQWEAMTLDQVWFRT